MKIGIYDPYLDTLSGGERYMLGVAACLAENHDVDVFWDEQDLKDRAAAKLNLQLSKTKFVKNIFAGGISIYKRLEMSKKYDYIIYLSDGSIPLTAAKKTILHFQFPTEWVSFTILDWLKLRRIYKVIVNSSYTKMFIDKKFHLNSRVIYPPVNLLKPVPFSDKENLILTVGRFSKLQNEDDFKKLYFMIKTFDSLAEKELKDWKFVIVSSYLEKDKLEFEKLKQMSKSKNIEIVSDISSEQLNKLYEKAKIYWHAAGYMEDKVNNPEKMEHFGISTVEALSSGCIPIVINLGGQKEIITDGVNGYLWTNEEELKEKTIKVAKWDKADININTNYDSLVKNYGQERFCKELKLLIQ